MADDNGEDRSPTNRSEEFPEAVGEETVGEILLAAREKSQMTLEAVSQQTRIPVSTLRYLETDNFEAIPARVYAKGFLRTYAEVLGLDTGRLLNRYEMQTGQTHKSRGDLWEIEEQVVEETLDSPRILRRFIVPAIVLAGLLLLLLRVFGGGDGQDQGGRSPDSAVEQAGDSSRGAGGAELRGASSGRDEAATDGQASAHGDDVRPAGGEGEGSAAPAPAESPRMAEETGDAEAPGPMVLTIRATSADTTWFDVLVTGSEEGESSERDFILYPGQVETLRADGSFLFRTIGNAGGFTLELDGRKLPPIGERGEVRRDVKITREGVEEGR